MVDKTGSGEIDQMRANDATSAAVHSYRAVYGDAVGIDTRPIVDALFKFWLARFREGYPAPVWLRPKKNQQAPAAREIVTTPPGPSEAVEGQGRLGGLSDSERRELERLKRAKREEGVWDSAKERGPR